MGTLLVKHAVVLVTMDPDRREIRDGGLFARDGWIEQVGPTAELPDTADEVLDVSGHVVIPGLINTHHHLYQTLTRALPGTQDAELFPWLQTLYPIWARITPDDIRLSTKVGVTELALSGCTTTSDHLYLFPNGSRLDDTIDAAGEIGIRFHAARGSMSLGESDGGLPPDSLVEDENAILEDTRRVIESYHDPTPGSMLRIVVAPCSPFSVTTAVMRESAELARSYGVSLHTHLAETADEEDFCLARFGLTPLAYAEHVGWLGPDVWFAHGVHVDDAGIRLMVETGTGVAHCPASNMRLGSGVAPVMGYLDAGVRVGLGVDGSASNDGNDLLGEARLALLLARVRHGERPLMGVRTALEIATLGGAAVLGRDDIGSLASGKAADFTATDLGRIEYAGAQQDPVAALLLCAPTTVDHTYVQGKAIVENGRPVTVDLELLTEAHNRAARRLLTP
ncbi:8-oxoguanine deaminase [bacterium BMS3Abin02]|nr:8-oxoguanine deaminase [bacterium BMS3Abin02]GBE21208.1 8-oxoguanine deaminase [bacterium BMS3Bbin01]HDH26034.1 8-oxoguanine deaminase [Actinomycetota bacterium]HDL50189.1 8-oxoguanine deaminase [Actinomycetota bacterium]